MKGTSGIFIAVIFLVAIGGGLYWCFTNGPCNNGGGGAPAAVNAALSNVGSDLTGNGGGTGADFSTSVGSAITALGNFLTTGSFGDQ